MLVLLFFSLPKTYIIKEKLDVEAMKNMAVQKGKQTYHVLSTNCVDAVVKTLKAGGFGEQLQGYTTCGIADPSKHFI